MEGAEEAHAPLQWSEVDGFVRQIEPDARPDANLALMLDAVRAIRDTFSRFCSERRDWLQEASRGDAARAGAAAAPRIFEDAVEAVCGLR